MTVATLLWMVVNFLLFTIHFTAHLSLATIDCRTDDISQIKTNGGTLMI